MLARGKRIFSPSTPISPPQPRIPNTKYSYRFGDSSVGLSDSYVFQSAPEEKNPNQTVTAIMYGDMGLDYSEYTRMRLAEDAATAEAGDAEFFDFVIHNGDIR